MWHLAIHEPLSASGPRLAQQAGAPLTSNHEAQGGQAACLLWPSRICPIFRGPLGF